MAESPSWTVERDTDSRVRVCFRGRLDAETGRASAARCVEVMGDASVHLLLDLSEVEAYAPATRKAWQTAVWPRGGQILSLTIVSRSQLTQMGARLFATFLGVPYTILDRAP